MRRSLSSVIVFLSEVTLAFSASIVAYKCHRETRISITSLEHCGIAAQQAGSRTYLVDRLIAALSRRCRLPLCRLALCRRRSIAIGTLGTRAGLSTLGGLGTLGAVKRRLVVLLVV